MAASIAERGLEGGAAVRGSRVRLPVYLLLTTEEGIQQAASLQAPGHLALCNVGLKRQRKKQVKGSSRWTRSG